VSTPVYFPDVELWATGYLRTALAEHGYPGVYVSNRRETQPVAVWIRRDGGPTLDVVRESARIGVNVYAAGPNDSAVSALTRVVSGLLRAAADGAPVCSVVQTSGPSPIADALPRRYMTFELVVRGTQTL
jgi:hypothetical protein